MKRHIVFLIFSMVTIVSFAQSIQNGIVKEYNDAKKKTPLAGVELVVNNAGSNVTGIDGRFTLNFRTLKPGDKIDVRKIEKTGYEIFNKDALDTWRIANDSSEFTIILCKSTKFKALKDQYNAVSSKSYAKQQKKDEDRLANLLKEGKIHQAEYEKKLNELKNKYDEQLENLDNYIDRFARIDLETLSTEEQCIIEMVKEGKIEEAIKAYENMHLEEKYAQAIQNIGVANSAMAQLERVKVENLTARNEAYLAVKRMNDARRLQGGTENFLKIGETLKTLAIADSTNLEPVLEYAAYCHDQNLFNEAISGFIRCEALATGDDTLSVIFNRLGNIYNQIGVYNEAERFYNKALEIELKSFEVNHNVNVLERVLAIYNGLGIMCWNCNNYLKSKEYFNLAVELYKKNKSLNNMKSVSRVVSTIYSNLGGMLHSMGDLETAKTIIKDGVNLLVSESTTDISIIKAQSTLLFNLAVINRDIKSYEEAFDNLRIAEDLILRLVEYNRDSYMSFLFDLYDIKGLLFQDTRNYVKSIEYLEKSVSGYKELYMKTPNAFIRDISRLSKNLGNSYYLNNDYLSAINSWNESKEYYIILYKDFKEMKEIATENIKSLTANISELLYEESQWDNAIEIIDNSLSIIGENDVLYYQKAKNLLKKGEREKALSLWGKVQSINPDFLSCYPNYTELQEILDGAK